MSNKPDSFKTSAVVGLSHILRLNSGLTSLLIEKLNTKFLIQKLLEDQPRIQQALLTIILSVCINNNKFVSILLEDKNFIKCIFEFSESSIIVLRGKSLLLLSFLLKSSKSLSKIADSKFFGILEKTMRDYYKYVQNCFFYLLESLNEVTLLIVKQLYEDLKSGTSASGSVFPLISQVLLSSAARTKLYYPTLIKFLSELLKLCTQLPLDLSSQILILLESFSSHGRSLAQYSEPIISVLLPNLLDQRQNSNTDIRFSSLKVFSDIVLLFLYEESIYDSNNSTKITTKMINDLLIKQFFPALKLFIEDQDPIPLYSLKLLSGILERCMAFIRIVKNQNLFPVLLENFFGGNPKLNLHLISIVKKIIESQENTLEELVAMGVIHKVNSVMKIIFDQDWCVEKMLDILYELLFLAADNLRTKKVNQDFSVLKLTENLSENFTLCTKILKFMNEPVIYK